MKRRLVLVLIGLALAVPAFSQVKEVTDPEIRQQIEAIDHKFDEACDNNDAAAVAALFTQGAVNVTPTGVFSGQQAIEKYFAGIFQQWHVSDHINKLAHVYEFGSHLCTIGEWAFKATSQPEGGYRTLVYSRENDNWKIRVMVVVY